MSLDSTPRCAGRIPRIIHYCWFGGGSLPEKSSSCFASWARLLDGYFFQRWDEHNGPMSNAYVKRANEYGKYANISNFVRLFALREYGGIYLDVDVELVKPLDDLLGNDCFMGFETEESVNNAVIGAQPRSRFVESLLSAFDGFSGQEPANESAPVLVTSKLRDGGLVADSGEIQCVGEVTVYPKRFFYPYSWTETFDPACVTRDTYSIHHWLKQW